MTHRIISRKATTTVMPEASPSMPSVRFTALENPVMRTVATATKAAAGSTIIAGFWTSTPPSRIHAFRPGRFTDRAISENSLAYANLLTP